jgi:hypothetical protein
MTTWELATDAQKQEIQLLLRELRRAGIELPPFPGSAAKPDLDGLTKRDAGTLLTQLREALKTQE